jgi:hypothetical protein
MQSGAPRIATLILSRQRDGVDCCRATAAFRQGPHLDDYYTTYPVVSKQGVTVFWRHGELQAVDTALHKRTLWKDEGLAGKKIMTRMPLADDGPLLFGQEDELFLVPIDLGPMANSPWPCGGGNAQGNPVFQGG